MKTPEQALKELKEFMETLRDFDTWKEWRNTDPIEEVEWDDSHELSNVMNKMVDELDLPIGDKETIPFYLQDWRTIDETSQEYTDVLYKTQELVPVDSGLSYRCYHSDYELDGIMYRLTWRFTDVESDEPTMQRRFN